MCVAHANERISIKQAGIYLTVLFIRKLNKRKIYYTIEQAGDRKAEQELIKKMKIRSKRILSHFHRHEVSHACKHACFNTCTHQPML